jgi:hypothetical protein
VIYKNPTPYQTRRETKTSKGELQDKIKGSSSMAKHVHISLIIAYKLLSSLHKGKHP